MNRYVTNGGGVERKFERCWMPCWTAFRVAEGRLTQCAQACIAWRLRLRESALSRARVRLAVMGNNLAWCSADFAFVDARYPQNRFRKITRKVDLKPESHDVVHDGWTSEISVNHCRRGANPHIHDP